MAEIAAGPETCCALSPLRFWEELGPLWHQNRFLILVPSALFWSCIFCPTLLPSQQTFPLWPWSNKPFSCVQVQARDGTFYRVSLCAKLHFQWKTNSLCQPQPLLVPSTNIFPEPQAQGGKPGITKLATSPNVALSDLQRWVELLGITCGALALSVKAVLLGAWCGSWAAQQAVLGLVAPGTRLSEHRLAGHARPPATLAPSVIHVVQVVGGGRRW